MILFPLLILYDENKKYTSFFYKYFFLEIICKKKLDKLKIYVIIKTTEKANALFYSYLKKKEFKQ